MGGSVVVVQRTFVKFTSRKTGNFKYDDGEGGIHRRPSYAVLRTRIIFELRLEC